MGKHTCTTLLIRCIDFRLTKPIHTWLESQGLSDQCDVVSWAGSAQNLSNGLDQAQDILGQIKLAKKLHQIERVIIMNHGDCGAYGGRSAFDTEDHELSQHRADLNEARKKILAEIPEIQVRLTFAHIHPDTGMVTIEEIT